MEMVKVLAGKLEIAKVQKLRRKIGARIYNVRCSFRPFLFSTFTFVQILELLSEHDFV